MPDESSFISDLSPFMSDLKCVEHVLDDGRKLKVLQCDFNSCNILHVEAGTNGYHGGDGGHGGVTYFSISNGGGTGWDINSGYDGFDVTLNGDTELSTIIQALRFIADTLESQTNK